MAYLLEEPKLALVFFLYVTFHLAIFNRLQFMYLQYLYSKKCKRKTDPFETSLFREDFNRDTV